MDCDTIPECQMTCAGPNEELMRAVILHAGCTVEWLLHAGWLKGVATVVMFVFMNMSRVVLVGAIVKLNWRCEKTKRWALKSYSSLCLCTKNETTYKYSSSTGVS